MVEFPQSFVPFAVDFPGDMRTCYGFVDALCDGLTALDKEIPGSDKLAWNRVQEYLKARPF